MIVYRHSKLLYYCWTKSNHTPPIHPPLLPHPLRSTTTVVTKDTSVFLPPPGQVPMPDLTSQPLDPNEPTYCLCNQVSFGEMIGCDNDDVSQGHCTNILSTSLVIQ